MVMEYISGPITASIRATGKSIKYQGTENTPGMMAELTRDIGKTTICMVKESINGQTAVNMKVNI